MSRKLVFRYFRPGDLAGLERALNDRSRGGWQAVKPGRFFQRYERGPGVYVHRIGCSVHRPGSGDEITYLAAQERAGWQLAARRGPWLLYRKPVEDPVEDETLVGHRDPVRTLFARRIAGLETLRRWLLVLGTAVMLLGYFSEIMPLFYATVLPLAAALFVTYRIKFMDELR